MYTLGAERNIEKSIISVCLLNLMAWKASWAHRTCENEKKEDYDKIKKSVQTSSACGLKVFFTIYGRDGHLGHVTQIPRTISRSPYPRRLHIKFGFDRPSGFRGEDV